jgi:deoxycytidylate deaminase
LSKKDKAFLSVARYLATKSKSRNTHGAVVVKSGRVIGTGWNKTRNNPATVSPEHIKSDCSYHAEEIAIRESSDSNLRGAVIYVQELIGKAMTGILSPVVSVPHSFKMLE